MAPKRRPNATNTSSSPDGPAVLDLRTPRSPSAQFLETKAVAAAQAAEAAAAMHSPLLPTPTEAAFLAVYPLTLLLGSLFSHFSPSLRPPANLSTYSPLHQSFQPSALAPSYWATKRNVLNVYFVKLGWFWCTLALLLFTLLAARGRSAIDIGLRVRQPRTGSPKTPRRLADMDATSARTERDDRLRRQYQVLLRYAFATAAWLFATQWFLGAPLIDRVFQLTGGACRLAAEEAAKADPSRLERLAGAASYSACRSVQGRWSGGLDISGHVFLLVLGSGMLALETLPIILPWVRGLTAERIVHAPGGPVYLADEQAARGNTDNDAWTAPLAAAAQASDGPSTRLRRRAEDESRRHTGLHLKSWGITAVLGFVGLSWWMLLMTAAFFHTWVEKSVACVLAGAALWVIYFAPRAAGSSRHLVGMPGV